MLGLKGLDTALNSGVRAAVVDRYAVATAPKSFSQEEAEFRRPDGAPAAGPRVLENDAWLCKLRRRQLGECSVGPSPVGGILSGAICFAE